MNIFVTFPVSPASPHLHKQVVQVSWRLLADDRHKLQMIIPAHNPFENNLHHCVLDFLKSDCAFWLSIDADNPPMKNPLDLIEYDRDIMGLPTPVWHFTGNKVGERPIYWNAYDYVAEKDAYKEHQCKKGLQEVDAIGTGCFLISRRVFENKEMQKAPFERKLNVDGTVNKGNDISFCERAKKNNFEIWTHYDYSCRHYNTVELAEACHAFHSLYCGAKDG